MVTMKDIGLKVGVSASTVSRVLNGKDRGRIKPHIASEIRRQAELSGYEMNSLARSLRTKKSRLLGFISDDIATTPYAGRIIQGAQDAARECGYILLTVNTNDDTELERAEILTMQQYGVDGFLYATMYNRIVNIPDILHDSLTVIVDAEDKDRALPSICPDERQIGIDAVRCLLDAGCTRIGYFNSYVPIVAQRERLIGFREAMEASPFGYDPDDVIECDEAKGADLKARELFDRHVDGIFCFNDVRAPFLYEEARRRGLTIGKDVSIVSVDNQQLIAGILSPALTSIELPHYEMGYWGARKLISLIEGHSNEEDMPHGGGTVVIPGLAQDHVRIRCTIVSKASVASPDGR